MNIIIIGITGALLFFAVQLVLCCKVKRMAVKLIPLYVIVPFIVIMVLDFSGLLNYSGVISAKGILGILLAIITGADLVGDGLAWVIYRIRKRKGRIE